MSSQRSQETAASPVLEKNVRRWRLRTGPAVAVLFIAAVLGAMMGTGSTVVVGIGDSVTAATNCACPGFVDPYGADLPTSASGPARGVNLGANGLTAARLRTLVTTPTPTVIVWQKPTSCWSPSVRTTYCPCCPGGGPRAAPQPVIRQRWTQ